jgi:predicted GIY-YIG superfamily endonuclease
MVKAIFDKETESELKDKIKKIDGRKSAIYFLEHKGEIVYVGASLNVKGRIETHLFQKTKVFDDFNFIECKKDSLDASEFAYIQMYDPAFNTKDALTPAIDLKKYCDKHKIPHKEIEKAEAAQVRFIAPADLLDAFDKMIQERPEVLNRTSLLLQLMNGEVKRHNRAKKAERENRQTGKRG